MMLYFGPKRKIDFKLLWHTCLYRHFHLLLMQLHDTAAYDLTRNLILQEF